MKIRDGYTLQKIADQTYLLPYGQNIAEHRRGIRLNESGILLWNALQQDMEEASLLSALTQHYINEVSELPALREDIHAFFRQLTSAGILYQEIPAANSTAPFYFQIGTVTLGFDGPKQLIHPSFLDFSCEAQKVDQLIRIIPGTPAAHTIGTILVRTDEITICANENSYFFLYPDSYGISECHLSKDGSRAEFYCRLPLTDDLSEKLFHAIRFTFLVRAQLHGLFALHSASVFYRGKAWLFSASAGTGKSTHAFLWNSLFQTPILNGDLNLIGLKQQEPVIYGIPWCGTSGIYSAECHSLGGITLLKQHMVDEIMDMQEDEKQLSVMQRMISPSWTPDMLRLNLDFAKQLAGRLDIYRLFCTKEDSAAITIKQAIDSSLTLHQ